MSYVAKFDDGSKIELNIVKNLSLSKQNRIYQAVSVNGDSGHTVFIGSDPETIQLQITFNTNDISRNLKLLERLIRTKMPFTLQTGFNNANLFGKYYFSSYATNIEEGKRDLVVTVELVKHMISGVFKQNCVLGLSNTQSQLLKYLNSQNQL